MRETDSTKTLAESLTGISTGISKGISTGMMAYEFIKKEEIDELNSVGYLLCHKKTGARVVLLVNEDNNKVFNIGFRTPPADSTGVAHIIEHTVLCGSKKYPPKDPFVELAKGSLNTFLNAMTFSDKTIYPVASCNEKDFKNLMNVYLDAVFYPNIYKKEEIFRQEGWSYELEDKDKPLIYNGVVYNEMKGALSTPERLLMQEAEREMFPDTCYSHVSGGDPKHIPELSYEQFLDFHRKYYHPSNSYIYLYGNMDMPAYLEWIDREYLSNFEKSEVKIEFSEQKPFEHTKYCVKQYPLGEGEEERSKSMYSYIVTAGGALDRQEHYAMKVLDYALLSMPGAPVKQALLDAGIGKDISGGFSNGTLQNSFYVTAKEAEEGKQDKFQEIIENTLRSIVESGVDKDSLKAALNVFEFQYREADFGSYPKGLFYCMDILESWLYDDNEPFMHIHAGKTFQELNEYVNTEYYENLIQKYLLNNSHKLIITMNPKRGLAKEMAKELEEKLAAYKASLSEEELEKIIEDTKALKKYQSEPSTEEELNTIPVLKLEDIDRLPEEYYIEEREEAGIKVIFSNVFSNKIAYINASFDAGQLPKQYIPYLGLLKSVLANMDTAHYKYTELNNLIYMHSGGFYNDFVQYGRIDGGSVMLFENNIKVLYSEIKQAFNIISEILGSTKFSDTKRLYEIIAEQKSGMRMRLISAGHIAAMTRAESYMTETGYVKDMTSGIGYYRFLEDLEKNFEQKKEEAVQMLTWLSKYLFTKKNFILSFTADEEGYKVMKQELETFTGSLSAEKCVEEREPFELQKLNEGYKIPSPVSYVARLGNYKTAGYAFTGIMNTLGSILDYGYLWNQVRVKGGAYGVMSFYGPTTGNVAFLSYRDPNVGATNDVFNGIPEYLRNFEADDRDILKYIIGTISSKDTPKNPSAKGRRSFTAYISGITYEDICREREEILSLSVEKVRALAPIMEAVLSQNYICTVGSSEKIEESTELFGEIKDLF